MIKLNSLSRWRPLRPGDWIDLAGAEERVIRLYVNSPGRALLYIDPDGDEPRFLAAPEGCEEVEFSASGVVRIGTSSQDVWVHTAELETTWTVFENAESYTGPMNRAARNPEVEMMMLLAQQNIDRRMAALDQLIEEKAKYDPEKPTVARSAAPGADPQVIVGAKPKSDGDGEPDGGVEQEDEPRPA